MTFRDEFYSICSSVAKDFDNWSFARGLFKNGVLKHTNLYIGLGSSIQRGFHTNIQPAICIENKRFAKLWQSLLGYRSYTSVLRFQDLSNELIHVPKPFRLGASIRKDKEGSLVRSQLSDAVKGTIIDLEGAKPFIRGVLMDGITIIDKYYDLSSEEALLRHLPPKRMPTSERYEEFETNAGIRMCVVHILLGDFDFVELYRSDAFKTTKPKRYVEIDTIIAALPELRRRYLVTGSVV